MDNDEPLTVEQLIEKLQAVEDKSRIVTMEGCDCDSACYSIDLNWDDKEVYLRRPT